MKIIAKSNFDDESFSEYTICEKLSDHWADIIWSYISDKYTTASSEEYFKIVPDDYELYKFDPNK